MKIDIDVRPIMISVGSDKPDYVAIYGENDGINADGRLILFLRARSIRDRLYAPLNLRKSAMQSSPPETIIAVLAALAEVAPANYAEIIDDAIERVQYIRYRNRERDQDSVIYAIRRGATTARDIATETQISHGHTCFLLRRLVRANRVGFNLQRSQEPGRPQKIYYLREIVTRKNKTAA